ncbi:MAG TPA: cell wall protein [Hyalangium sp.]|nr:cell wall protein [Hyalangium sp.]
MSLEKALREMIRRELGNRLAPLQRSIGQLERGLASLQSVRDVTGRLAPLLGERGRQVVMRHAQAHVTPQRAAPPARTPAAAQASKAKAAPAASSSQLCAVIGCKKPSRSKGYCSAHYQKLRLLVRTGRRPKDWVDDATPQSARDMKLPRGRAAGGARQPAPAAPREPPKPKAWVRKKGGAGMVSLH